MLDVDVISEPSTTLGHGDGRRFWEIDLRALTRHDVNLVKPAVLFGDRVKLISFRNDMKALVRADSFENLRMPVRYMQNYAGLSIRADPSELKLLNFPASSMCTEADAQIFFDPLRWGHEFNEIMTNFARKYSEQLTEFQTAVGYVLRSRWEDLSSDDMDRAVEFGILQYVPWLQVDTLDEFEINWMTTDTYTDAALDAIIDRLANLPGIPLLDQGARRLLVKPLDGQGAEISSVQQKLPDYGTAIATMLSVQLPGLHDLSIGEIIDLRSELSDHLNSFRGYMVELSDELTGMPDADSNALTSKLTSHWEKNIGPVLENIRHELKIARYPRCLLDAFAEDRASIASVGSAIVLGVGTTVAGLGALIPAVAAASYPFVRALSDRVKARDEICKNRLYFLHGVIEKIGKINRAKRN